MDLKEIKSFQDGKTTIAPTKGINACTILYQLSLEICLTVPLNNYIVNFTVYLIISHTVDSESINPSFWKLFSRKQNYK